jgi:hypothetical protein
VDVEVKVGKDLELQETLGEKESQLQVSIATSETPM